MKKTLTNSQCDYSNDEYTIREQNISNDTIKRTIINYIRNESTNDSAQFLILLCNQL